MITFLLWTFFFFLHSLGLPICMVYVGVFLDMGVIIHVGSWGHTLACISQRLLDHHSSSLVHCHSTGRWFNQHPQGNIYLWIIWGDLHVVFQFILIQHHQQPMKIWLVAIFASKGWPCFCIDCIHEGLGSS